MACPDKLTLTPRCSGLLQELRLQAEADAVDLAVHIVVAVDQADALGLAAFFQHDGRALDLEVFDQDDGIAVDQDLAIGIADHLGAVVSRAVLRRCIAPLMTAIGADIHCAVAIGVLERADGAGGWV